MAEEQQQEGSIPFAFDPNEHMMQLKSREGSKDYLPVQWRIVWFRLKCPQGTIDTDEIEVDLDREVEEEAFVWDPETRRSVKTVKRAKGYARFKATVTDGKGGKAQGTKSENAASFPDFVEKAETGAVGRALAALGYGTAFAPELTEAHRIVDSPVNRDEPAIARVAEASKSTPYQHGLIRDALKTLGREASSDIETYTSTEAGKMIYELNKEIKQMPKGAKA